MSIDQQAHPVAASATGELARRTGAGQRKAHGRPRNGELDTLVLQAGLSELARGGFSHFSVSAVARRAGVAKGTVYLRWPTREQLILDVCASVVADVHVPTSGTLAERLGDLVRQWAQMLGQPLTTKILQRLGADRDDHPQLFSAFYRRVQLTANQVVERTIREAQDRGEASAAVEAAHVTRIFVGALYVEALSHVPAGQISEEFGRALVRFCLSALRQSGPGAWPTDTHGAS